MCVPRSNGCPPNNIGVKNFIKAEYGKVRVISVFVMLRFRLSLPAYVGGQAVRRMGIVQRLERWKKCQKYKLCLRLFCETILSGTKHTGSSHFERPIDSSPRIGIGGISTFIWYVQINPLVQVSFNSFGSWIAVTLTMLKTRCELPKLIYPF